LTPGKENREEVCKVCESDRRTVTHLMKEYVGGQRGEGGEKREKVLGTEDDELDWTEQVMRKRRKRESKAQGKEGYAGMRSNLRDVGRQ